MLEKLRNIGIIAHVDAGKTTTTERILYYSGTKHKVGDIDDGDTTTDFDPAERQRGITINSAAVAVEWDGHVVSIIDTPGHVDFTAEVERSMRVLDGAIGVFCGVGGVEVQSETVWFQANKYKVPRIAYVNKLDRMGADFYDAVQQMVDKLGANPAICCIPWGHSDDFKGIIDLIRMKFIKKDMSDGKHLKFEFVDIPEEMVEQAQEYRQKLLDAAGDADDEVAELVMEEQAVPDDKLKKALRKGTLEMKITPVFCGSSKNFQGVQRLLDGVIDFLPSPPDVPPIEGVHIKTDEPMKFRADPDADFAGLAFKTVAEPTGDLVYVRVYSGKIKAGEVYLNTMSGKDERISRLVQMMGDKRVTLEEAGPGMIVGVMGLKQTYTGNTLCAKGTPVALESITFPAPVISQAVIPEKGVDEGKMAEILGRMLRDDPTLKAETDPETNELVLSGMGELHLEVSVEKMQRFPGIKVRTGKPKVAYRQTISKPIELLTKYVKQTGGSGKFAHIKMQYKTITKEEAAELAEKAREDKKTVYDNNVFFADSITGGVIPAEYIPGVEKGIREMCEKGPKYGFPCVDLYCELIDGKYHDVDSSIDAFKLAARENFRDALTSAGITLLEPIMKVVVVTPEDFQGPVTGDISKRRGIILETTQDKRCTITAEVPLANLFGYTSDLRSATSGKASFSMEFSHYAPVAEELADLRTDDK